MTSPANPQAGVARWQRSLLPGGLLEARSTRRSARDWAVDLLMLLVALAVGALLLGDDWDGLGAPARAGDLVLGVISLMALWFRRSHPVAVGVLVGLASIVSAASGGAALIALFSAAIRAPWRGLAAVVAIALVATGVFPLIHPGEESYTIEAIIGLLVTIIAIGWGLFVRARRELVHSLRDRAVRLESEQRLRVEQAREAERRRIAREMHDVLAHRISLLSVHAGALEFRPGAPPAEIAEAAGVIRASAHSALQELREVIGVLREGSEEGAPEPPQPTLALLPALVDESRAAGMRVECRIEAPVDELPAALGRTAYRVVQEGLTNARKHAPRAAVRVGVRAESGSLLVELVSRRAVGAGASALPGAGTGLVGLAERVALAGGELRHGPDGDGDFVLRATLPWPS